MWGVLSQSQLDDKSKTWATSSQLTCHWRLKDGCCEGGTLEVFQKTTVRKKESLRIRARDQKVGARVGGAGTVGQVKRFVSSKSRVLRMGGWPAGGNTLAQGRRPGRGPLPRYPAFRPGASWRVFWYSSHNVGCVQYKNAATPCKHWSKPHLWCWRVIFKSQYAAPWGVEATSGP